jgi:hypothetical protein
MRLRIETSNDGPVTVVRVDGDLKGEASAELERVCEEVPGPLKIDLVNLLSFDPEGAGTLRSLERRGAELVRVSPYFDLVLAREGVRRTTR